MVPLINLEERRRKIEEGLSGSDTSSDEDQHYDSTSKKLSIRQLYQEYAKHQPHLLSTFNSRSFNIFTFEAPRQSQLPVLSLHLVHSHNLLHLVNEVQFANFLALVTSTYRQSVQYHNDLHGFDVAHMAHLFLTQGNLKELAELQEVDVLSLLVAALCHDLGHDGLTNGYHVNAMSERAVRYSDVSVQENYHAAETFKLMQREQFLNVT